MVHRANEYRRLVESLRIMLAIIAGILVLDAQPKESPWLTLAVMAFSAYAVILLWRATQGALDIQRRFFYWLDACWFLLFVYLAGDHGTRYFLFLLFPIFFAAWRTGYRESVAIAAFSGLGSLIVLALTTPNIPWRQLLAMPFSLFVIAQVFVALARIDEAARNKQAQARQLAISTDPRHGFDAVVADLIVQIARKLDAPVALLAFKTTSGRCRAICWEDGHDVFELSEEASAALAGKLLALPADVSVGWTQSENARWWRRNVHFEIGPTGLPSDNLRVDRETLVSLAQLAGNERLLSSPVAAGSSGKMRLLLAGASTEVSVQSLSMLQGIVEPIGPLIENACLREELANQAAEAERARIGRDLHDSAIQPYIGLKFAVEAVQRRAGPDNPIAPDLARLTGMVTDELATMREVVSGLRGDPGKGGALLSSAVRRHAARCGQLFGIQVEVEIEQDMPVSRRLAGELFHMVAEGLSNIGRHTQSRWAWVSLNMQGNHLILKIRNKTDDGTNTSQTFTPRSLTERAADLGGSVEIQRGELQTTVTISVPISTDTSANERLSPNEQAA